MPEGNVDVLGVPAGAANRGRGAAAAARSAAVLGKGSGYAARRAEAASDGGERKCPEDCRDMLGVCRCSIDLISCRTKLHG